MEFVNIIIERIEHIHFGWPCGIKTMEIFVKKCWLSKGEFSLEDKNFWTTEIYGAVNENNLERIDKYIKYIMGFYANGYCGVLFNLGSLNQPAAKPPLNSDYEVLMKIGDIEARFFELLPRIHQKDHDIDDGHHRIPIYSCLGIDHFPFVVVSGDNLNKSIDNFVVGLRESLDKFFVSDTWKEYKTGEDYNKLLTRTGKTFSNEYYKEKN